MRVGQCNSVDIADKGLAVLRGLGHRTVDLVGRAALIDQGNVVGQQRGQEPFVRQARRCVVRTVAVEEERGGLSSSCLGFAFE